MACKITSPTPIRDFYLWGVTKNKVHLLNSGQPADLENLKQRVLDVLRSLNGDTIGRVCSFQSCQGKLAKRYWLLIGSLLKDKIY